MNPWTIESIITNAKAMAERNGFELLPGEYNIIKILATKPPYGKNVTIAHLNDWASVELYFTGYEQAKMELGIVDALAKASEDDRPLYAKPFEWQGLTDEEIHDCFQNRGRDGLKTRKMIAAAIEAMLKEKNT